MTRPLILAAVALVLAFFGATTLFSGKASAVMPDSIVAAVTPGEVAPTLELGSFRLVKTAEQAPTFEAHARIPAAFQRPDGPVAAIVGGRASGFDQIPGAVLIEAVTEEAEDRRGFHQCTGTIVSDLGPQWVLTAAHCIEEQAVRFDIYYGGEGDGATRSTMRKLWGFEAFVPLDYERSSLRGDVALIRLVEPAKLRPHEMARLATRDELRASKDGDDVIVAGWGTTKGGDFGEETSPVLKEAVQVVRSKSPLAMAVSSPFNAVEGTCQGDSGGSLRSARDRRVVLGFLSYVERIAGKVCRDPGYESAFTGVGYLKWIAGL